MNLYTPFIRPCTSFYSTTCARYRRRADYYLILLIISVNGHIMSNPAFVVSACIGFVMSFSVTDFFPFEREQCALGRRHMRQVP
jgi:hypothetical protein